MRLWGKQIMNLKKISVMLSIFLITVTIPAIGEENPDNINFTYDYLSIIVGPYPQNPSNESIFIVWETSIASLNNSVHFGMTPVCDNIVYHNFSNDFHEIELNGLSPSTKYYYKVRSENIESEIYLFYTTFEEDESVRFISYGDTRGVWDNWINAGIVADAIEKEQPYFVIHSGDIVNDGRILGQWIDFFDVSNFIHNSTLYPSLGNHENYGQPYFKYFLLPNNEHWYSFDSGPVHFIALDSNYRNSLRLSQLFWLIKDLILNNKPYTVVYFHHPPYSSGEHGSTKILRWTWGFIFEILNVDIVFNGHDHCYERGKVGSVNYIVTGGGGAPPYDVGSSWWTVYSEKTFHYCLINASQEELYFEVKKPDGTIFDSFSIYR
jgi:hypothetical protein